MPLIVCQNGNDYKQFIDHYKTLSDPDGLFLWYVIKTYPKLYIECFSDYEFNPMICIKQANIYCCYDNRQEFLKRRPDMNEIFMLTTNDDSAFELICTNFHDQFDILRLFMNEIDNMSLHSKMKFRSIYESDVNNLTDLLWNANSEFIADIIPKSFYESIKNEMLTSRYLRYGSIAVIRKFISYYPECYDKLLYRLVMTRDAHMNTLIPFISPLTRDRIVSILVKNM